MPLASTCDIVIPAAAEGRGCGAFNAVQLEHVSAVIAGAEAVGVPVILQLSHNAIRYHGGLGPIGCAAVAAARAARVPVAVHLDHAESADLVREAVDLGFSSVMFDASVLDYADNVRATRAVVEHCRAHGVWVEAELGEVGGKDGVHAPGARTDPVEAQRFVAETGVDCLAVAVGNSHAMATRDARLDFALIAALRAQVGVPLVLHGSSGVADEHLTMAVRHGMTKINIATQLNKVFTSGVRTYLTDQPEATDPRKYLGAGRERVTAEISRLLMLLTAPA
ncbi:class II fructose-bisphosphate aldolase [Actinoalloteichus hymeniacidonis]|uniref:Ketose-bisphosphate aldolase n=1 Tax=Actinoalloteichus hymeniacidonis TaxID=340345 RepID=A0AAC9HRB8_9PSEU|nr:class II fructose-bisphosphate aldolase [Actinoalloteichus hymeniacidonis]AOS64147.1 ketose-bisphosphate aldolase [Actinoalloteichus hymeniacidonis]MBB5907787.1 fructose-bisphosphate aldolase class II [Actinoalloteichus hymeniacidonis]